MLISNFQERQQRSKLSQDKILRFLRDQCYSSPAILAQVADMSYRSIYKKLNSLKNKGYLISHNYTGIPTAIWGITRQGLAFSWNDNEEMENRRIFQPSRVKPLSFSHELALQQARVNFERMGGTDWLAGHLLPSGILKRPDAIVTFCGEKIFCEYESTIKSSQRYSQIWSIYLQKISRGEVDFVHYICPNERFASKLERVFGLLKQMPVAGSRVAIGASHRAKFKIFSLSEWPQKVDE